MKLSVIVPTLNEKSAIASSLAALRAAAPEAEIIVVDGGSADATVGVARPLSDLLIEAPRGRARQMNAGVVRASGDVLAFVHADTIVPAEFALEIERALRNQDIAGGRFDLRLDDRSFACRALGTLISWRSRLMRGATGDQAIFVRRSVFDQLGGYRELEICEDVDFVRRLRSRGRIACLRSQVVTSARRWRRRGLIRTIILMWLIKSLFLLGVSPAWLKRRYVDAR